MEIALKSFAVVSFLLLVSLSTGCDPQLCQQHCSSQGLPTCCEGPSFPCLCQEICPRNRIMSGPPVVNALGCDPQLCQAYCKSLGLPWCCSGLYGPCLCQGPCPLADSVPTKITEEAKAGATDNEPFIEEIVIA
ncbi:keratin-associated protein 10-8-like [Olea europaea var. sylvestris]|uniref:keratin-associated protein 10-8-like n=1 Tax=Olea europaea var. sylvestris TaxID=158386 RepID=UPI000C1D63ED|nr:keratin-associated protein 10-8-like [Olea europaea var. sylvestris]